MGASDSMKIAKLARVSGVNRSTIHHYLNVGLLPRPRRAGPKLHWFGAEHLTTLQQINALRERGWAISRIRAHLARARARKTDGDGRKRGGGMHRRIIEHATPLFAERGFDGVHLSELARELGIGKATLYRHFPNKQALFIDCVERVRFTLIPKEAREALEQRSTVEEQGVLRARAVLQHFDAYRMLTHLLGSLAHGEDAELAEKARKQLHEMVTNVEPLIRRAIREGRMRPLHSELLAYMLWGALIGAGEWLGLRGEFTLDRVLGEYVEFISLGFSGSPPGSKKEKSV